MTDNLPPLPAHWVPIGLLGANASFQRAAHEYAEEFARAAIAQQSGVPELCDSSCGTYDLASMILSDCGHSTNNQRLLDRVAARIDKRLSALLAASTAQPVQPSDPDRNPLSDDQRYDLVVEHLGPSALTGGKMTPWDIFMLGISACEASHGIAAPQPKD